MIINFYNKFNATIIYLAKMFIIMDINERMPTFDQLSNNLDVSRGTIQNSIKLIVEKKAVTLKPRGAIGTYLIDKDLVKLMELANMSNLLGAMALPYSKTYEGLASGLIMAFENNLGIQINMGYMRDATHRINKVLEGRYDFAVVSKLSAEIGINRGLPIIIVKQFGVGSYLSSHVLVFNKPNINVIENGMTVAIARGAESQIKLTKGICADKEVVYKEIDYHNVIDSVRSGEVDAAIWNRDEINHALDNIYLVPINDINESTEAVIIVDKNRNEMYNILNELINVDTVINIQKKVILGELVPNY